MTKAVEGAREGHGDGPLRQRARRRQAQRVIHTLQLSHTATAVPYMMTESFVPWREGLPMNGIVWDDQVQVRIYEMQTVEPGHPKIYRPSVLWDGITLAEAVKRWLRLPDEQQSLVTIFGPENFYGSAIDELAQCSDFPQG
jgi:hypothetical protein